MRRILIASCIAFALLFAVSSMVGNGIVQTPSVMAQDATAVPATDAQPAQTAQPVRDDDNDFPWGLLGLAGLAGLAGLRRREEPVRRETRTGSGNVGTYDQR